MPECWHTISLETADGLVQIGVRVTPTTNTDIANIYSRFLLDCELIGEFDGILLNRVASLDWHFALKHSSQGDSFQRFLGRRTQRELQCLSQLRVLLLMSMELKDAFRRRGLGVQILNQIITCPPIQNPWDLAFGWARSYDGKTEGKQLNQAAFRILNHYEKHLSNCVLWNKKSTFFICVPGKIQAKNAADCLQELANRNQKTCESVEKN